MGSRRPRRCCLPSKPSHEGLRRQARVQAAGPARASLPVATIVRIPMTDPPLFMNVGSRGRERPAIRTKAVFSRLTIRRSGRRARSKQRAPCLSAAEETGPMSTPGACAESPQPCPPGRVRGRARSSRCRRGVDFPNPLFARGHYPKIYARAAYIDRRHGVSLDCETVRLHQQRTVSDQSHEWSMRMGCLIIIRYRVGLKPSPSKRLPVRGSRGRAR